MKNIYIKKNMRIFLPLFIVKCLAGPTCQTIKDAHQPCCGLGDEAKKSINPSCPVGCNAVSSIPKLQYYETEFDTTLTNLFGGMIPTLGGSHGILLGIDENWTKISLYSVGNSGGSNKHLPNVTLADLLNDPQQSVRLHNYNPQGSLSEQVGSPLTLIASNPGGYLEYEYIIYWYSNYLIEKNRLLYYLNPEKIFKKDIYSVCDY